MAELAFRIIPGSYDLEHLCAFHREIFGDIYPLAGEIRVVGIAKSDPFCLPPHIETYSAEVFDSLAKERFLRGLKRDGFVDRLTHYFAEVNAIHQRAKFFINISLVPVPWLKWIRKSDDPADLHDPVDEEGAVTARVRHPENGFRTSDVWTATPDEVEARGRIAAQATSEAAAQFAALLEGHELLRRLETQAPLPGFCPDSAARAIFYLDAQHWQDARREIDDIAAYDPESVFVKWARDRLKS
ncbi:MAG TPA: hypothetical protein VFC19_05230 [Candidatus Limnocylindrales bacterium]|nr:hypothetical protein [Candidatus Limnocylindrales bacterium]